MESSISWDIVLYISLLTILCILPLIAVSILLFLGVQRGRAFLDAIILPDSKKLQTKFERLHAKYSSLSDEQLVQKIIHHESLKCGLVGFITGFGGLPFMAVTVPIDAVASLRIQSVMIQFIAQAYGHVEANSDAARLKTYLILAGSERITAVTTSMIRKLLLKILVKSFLKIVPFLGGLIGFSVNYVVTQAIGQMAIRWYKGDLRALGVNTTAETTQELLEQSRALRPATDAKALESD